MALELELDDNPCQYDDDDTDETTKFVLHSPVSNLLANNKQGQLAPLSPTRLPAMNVDNKNLSKPAPRSVEMSKDCDCVRRKGSSSSVVLQILVEDVKEFAHGINNNSSSNKSKVGTLDDDWEKKKPLETLDLSSKKIEIGSNERTVRTGWMRYIGIILAITSSMLFALCILIVKLLANDYHPYSVTFWRFQGVLLPSLLISFYYRVFKKQPIFNMVCPVRSPENRKTVFFLLVSYVHSKIRNGRIKKPFSNFSHSFIFKSFDV